MKLEDLEKKSNIEYFPGLHECPHCNIINNEFSDTFNERVDAVATSNQIHKHSFTCKKKGKDYCRPCYPQTIRN